MQRLLSLRNFKQLTINNVTANSNASLVHSHPYKSFPSLTRPIPGNNPIHHFNSTQTHHTLSGKLSNPLLSKHFLSTFPNVHSRVSTKRLIDSKLGFSRVQLSRRFSGFNFKPSYRSYGRGWRSWLNQLSPNDMVLGLIIINAAVFILWRIADREFMSKNFMISLPNFKSGRIHTLITSAFSHIDLEHIISNMVGLYFFGGNIARTFGSEFLLKLYLAGAIGGSVFYLLHHAFMALSPKREGMWRKDPSRTPGLGASGAVNAIMLLSIFLNPRATLYLDFIIPVPAALLGIFIIGKDILRITEGDSNISGSAHLGGAAVAAIAFARIKKGRF